MINALNAPVEADRVRRDPGQGQQQADQPGPVRPAPQWKMMPPGPACAIAVSAAAMRLGFASMKGR